MTGPDGRYQLRAGYLAGCDGAHSPVRKLAGIGFPGYTSPEVSRIGRVTLPDAVVVASSGEAELPELGRVRLAAAASHAARDVLDRAADQPRRRPRPPAPTSSGSARTPTPALRPGRTTASRR